MNEKIRELVEQCTAQEFSDCTGGFETFDKEKFAELIIRRCAEYCGHDPSGVAAMLEDFGLKETRW